MRASRASGGGIGDVLVKGWYGGELRWFALTLQPSSTLRIFHLSLQLRLAAQLASLLRLQV